MSGRDDKTRQSVIGPLAAVPTACTLGPSTGRAQVERWHAFDAQYALSVERDDTRLTVHYAKNTDSIRRLRELVDVERDCCSFVDWEVDAGHDDLRLIVTGTPDLLAALSIGHR